ncbi:MAG: AbrB/MazE/SpoVT family DNA-binding domain-containing protein [Sulfolobaceae archaeon]
MPETVVTRKYQVTIPKEVREALGIKVGDRLLVRVEDGKIIMEPIRASDALKRLSTIADKYLGGPKVIDAVRLVEESLERETGIY